MLWRLVQLTLWLAVRRCDVARAAHILVSRAGLTCIVQVRSTCHRALGAARDNTWFAMQLTGGWLCVGVMCREQLTL